MALYHFSEESGIARFVPRSLASRPGEQPLVWAIDEWHAPMYYFPRNCPRILLWPTQTTTEADHARWFGASSARMVAHIESQWLEALRTTRLYRYRFDERGFESLEDAGMFVSRTAVEPLEVEPLGSLLDELRDADVELRVLERLTPLRGVWDTTLHASGIRLRNAQGWAND